MIDDLFRHLFCWLSKPNLKIAHWLLYRCVTLQRRLEGDPDIPNRDGIQRAINLSVIAVQKMRNGHQYDKEYDKDPVRQAVDAVVEFFPKERNVDMVLPKENARSSALAAAIETLNQSAGTSEELTRLPITVTICKRAQGSQMTTAETISYSLSVDAGYTLDDLLFVVRLRDPPTLTKHPYIYSRPVNAHCHTHQGSKFEWKKESDSLEGLARTGPSGSGSVYFVIPETKFILLVEGVSPMHGEQINAERDDKLHIIYGLNDPITSELSQNKDRKRTFHHHSKAWKYIFEPDGDADITWKDLIAKKRVRLFRGEWIVCVG